MSRWGWDNWIPWVWFIPMRRARFRLTKSSFWGFFCESTSTSLSLGSNVVWTVQRWHTNFWSSPSKILTHRRWYHSKQVKHFIVGDSFSVKGVSTKGEYPCSCRDLPSPPQVHANISASCTISLQTGHISWGVGVWWETIALRAISVVNVISIRLYPGHRWAVFVV